MECNENGIIECELGFLCFSYLPADLRQPDRSIHPITAVHYDTIGLYEREYTTRPL